MEAGRLEEALDVLREGLEKHPDHAEICLHLGWVLYRLEDAEATRYARRVVQLEPEDAWVSLAAGWLLFYLAAYDLAAAALKQTQRNVSPQRHAHLVTKIGILAGKLAAKQGRFDAGGGALSRHARRTST